MKKWIIIIAIIILTLVIALTLIYVNNKEEHRQVTPEEGKVQERKDFTEKIQKVSILDDFYIVKSCVIKFYTYYSSIYNSTEGFSIIDEETEKYINNIKQEGSQAVYDMLSTEYKNFKNIDSKNILKNLKEEKGSTVDITQMWISEYNSDISRYFVKGTLRDKKSNISSFYIMVEIDSTNQTFGVFLEDYINEKYGNMKIGDSPNVKFNESIEKNEFNIYERKVINEDTYVSDMFDGYKSELLFNAEVAYSKLDEEYRQKKFGNINEFKNYLKTNTKTHITMSVDQYKKNKEKDYTQYVLIDNLGNYYIFRETGIMDYSVILDTYTIDLPEFLEKYENAKDEDKVILNLQKCFEALNNKDYRYVYNKLDTTFKTNNFKTEADFEKYIKANFFESNNAKSSNGKKQGDLYTYEVTITDKTEKDTKTVKKTFVMKLNEGTDFVMSFSI